MGSLFVRSLSLDTKNAVYEVMKRRGDHVMRVPDALKTLSLPNVRCTQTGWTMGHLMVWRNDVEGLRSVCESNPSVVDTTDCSIHVAMGNTPLHLAASIGDIDCMKVLLSLGADTTISNMQGKQPLELVSDSLSEAIRDFLRDLNPEDNKSLDLSATALISSKQVPDRTLSSPPGGKGKRRVEPYPLAEKYEY